MAKGAYVGINGIARKIKKSYVGVNDMARKIRAAYIGIGGVARPCWSSKELKRYGLIADLPKAASNLSAKSIGGYAVFAGGWNRDDSYLANVVTYTANLVQGVAANLSERRSGMASTTVGNYVLFACGSKYVNMSSPGTYITISEKVDAYSASLVHSTPFNLPTQYTDMGGTRAGNYALLGCGNRDGRVYSVTSNLVMSEIGGASEIHWSCNTTSLDGYGFFAGGQHPVGENSSYPTDVVDVYTSNLVRVTASPLTYRRRYMAATSVGEYAIFAGGASYDSNNKSVDLDSGIVDAYTSNLVKSSAPQLWVKRQSGVATTVNGIAVIAGGSADWSSGEDQLASVETYDESLTHSIAPDMVEPRCYFAGTSIGNYAIFGGSHSWYSGQGHVYLSSVEAYAVIE